MIRHRPNPSAAMQLSGHKTRRVFDRNDIVNDADRVRASELLHRHFGSRGTARRITRLVERRDNAE